MFKRFKENPVFDSESYPMPPTLEKSMDLVARSFPNFASRNLDVMNTDERCLYGLMTHYESRNFCWVQPTRLKSKFVSKEYDDYIKRINKPLKHGEKTILESCEPGTSCLARYDVDRHWYRAIIIDHVGLDQWLVLFIDYGNFQVCNTMQLRRPIIADATNEEKYDHFHAPMQAVCCRLYNIVPVMPVCQNREEIDIRMEKFLNDHVGDFLEIKVRNRRPDFVVDCDIFLPSKGQIGTDRLFRRHIGQEVVDEGIAKFADSHAAHVVKPAPKQEAGTRSTPILIC